MNMLKKSLALIATLAIASTALVACGDSSSKAAEASKAEASKAEASKAEDSKTEDSKDEASKTDEKPAATLPDTGDKLTVMTWNTNDIVPMFKLFGEKKGIDASKLAYTLQGTNGGEASEKYATYLAGDEDADLMFLEADWILNYINTDKCAPLSALGFKDSDFSGNFAYTVAIGKDTSGVQKATSWQATPGAYAYRTDLADKYLGVKSEEEMQAKVKDWDTFTETAKALKEASKGKCAMIDTLGGMWQIWQYNREKAWLNDKNELTIDDFCKKYADLAKTYYTEGYTTKESQWSNGWLPMGADGSVMGFVACTWWTVGQLPDAEGGVNKDEAGNITGGKNADVYGKYKLVAGPSTFAWGGTWLGVAAKCDNATLAHDFVEFFTVNEESMEQYALASGDFVNNPKVMQKIVDEKKNSNPLLGGQDQFALYNELAKKINMEGKITPFDSQIKSAFTAAVENYCKGNTKSVDETLEQFKDKASEIKGIKVVD